MHIRNISAGTGWQEVEFVVVGGAPETVIGEGMLSDIPTREGAASRRGVQYESASGERIVHLGAQSFAAHRHTHKSRQTGDSTSLRRKQGSAISTQNDGVRAHGGLQQ